MQATTMQHNNNIDLRLREDEDEEEQQSERFSSSSSPSPQSQPPASSSSSSVQPKAKAALALTALLATTACFATATMGAGKGFSATSSAMLSPVGRSLSRKGAGSSGYELHHDEESSNPELEFMKRSKGKSSRHKNGISGSNINAYTVPTGGEAIFNDVVFDASNIKSFYGDEIIKSVGLSLQKSSEATICSAKLIKGGLVYVDYLGTTVETGAPGIYVDEGSSLDIVKGNIEGGDAALGSYGLQVKKEAKVRIGPGRYVNIRAGERGNGKRNTAVQVAGGQLDVYGGKLSDESRGNVLPLLEVFGSGDGYVQVPGIVNIHGGKFHSGKESPYDFGVGVALNGTSPEDEWSKVNFYGENLEKVLLNGDEDDCKELPSHYDRTLECFYHIWGTLSDGNNIDVRSRVLAKSAAQRDAAISIINSDDPFNPPDFSDVC